MSVRFSSTKLPWRSISVDTDTTERLDAWLSNAVKGLSRRAACGMIASGQIVVNGRLPAKSERVKQGSIIEILSQPALSGWLPKADSTQSLVVYYQDDSIAVVEKNSGISAVPLGPEDVGCLANFVAAAFPQCAGIGRRPGDGGLLQRLDFETSGLVMVALSQSIHQAITVSQKRGEVAKHYLALVHGEPPMTMRINTPLKKSGRKGGRMRSHEDGVDADTSVRLVSGLGNWSLVEALIHHGVRHQIRAHLAGAGFPIVADSTYGDGRAGPDTLNRLFLHSHRVTFIHPVSGCEMTVESPLPDALEEVLGRLSHC